ncbi:MAG: DUF924 domain-containing protein [Oscillatoriales cyanobacterium]|nr:MAG: DUF924 domain-containing protein [Oscillatoriales cyanobacterium]
MKNQSDTRLLMNEVLDFWFGRSQSPEFGKVQKKWFEKDADFDTEVRCLALIILLDQFPRNMFRENPQAFATDSKALAAAQHAVNNNFDRELLTVQKWFIYLPFEHSENLEHQQKSVELFRQLSGEPDSESVIDFAVRHFKIIERFGRFPHRNQILGRETTPEEGEFLRQPGSGF